jgi:hypothetical protein
VAALPSLPGWQALHPSAMHIAIPVLVLAPLFIVLAVALRKAPSLPFLRTALALVAAGTIFLYLTGGDASALACLGGASLHLRSVLNEHLALAELTRTTFAGLTVILAAIVFAPRRLGNGASLPPPAALPVVYLLLYLAGIVILTHTARRGVELSRELNAATSAPASPHVVAVRASSGD